MLRGRPTAVSEISAFPDAEPDDEVGNRSPHYVPPIEDLVLGGLATGCFQSLDSGD